MTEVYKMMHGLEKGDWGNFFSLSCNTRVRNSSRVIQNGQKAGAFHPTHN